MHRTNQRPNAARRLFGVLLASSFVLAAGLPASAAAQDKASAQKVRLTTSMGDIVLELQPEKAPKTVENFLQYVRDKHYDGTIFHRVMDGFMIQGGGFTADFQQKPTRAPVPLEATNGLKNDRGTIAMARTANPNSATAQFFINVVDNAMLNAPNPDGHGYTVFGRVVQGMDAVDKIRTVPIGNKGPHQNVPTTPVTIIKATLEK
ncbi:MAG: peptidyl-prolyl cis-trans isomerase [Hydrogenophaga sp.]|jgi:peptidyl-prolyl cis-trans isomerase A (cyclophilin A)|nr:peptidyl-prolyl cis-trans isomerase [Hydrogenophaga sp.]